MYTGNASLSKAVCSSHKEALVLAENKPQSLSNFSKHKNEIFLPRQLINLA
jgi:hypothetical protein